MGENKAKFPFSVFSTNALPCEIWDSVVIRVSRMLVKVAG